MLIVIPGALPSLPVAAELARLLPQRAPVLHGWLQAAAAQVDGFNVRAQGCTPYEAWQLEQAGYRPAAGTPVGAGLGPFLAGDAISDDHPVWLADLAHLSLGTDQAVLLDPGLMDIRADEAQTLLATALPSIEAAGFGVTVLTPQRWRLTLPAGLEPRTGSPAAVAGQPLRDWWSQDAAMRPWRRLLNEIQMAWHEHPANEARAERGLPPINALWLYGGARRWEKASPGSAPSAGQMHLLTELDAAHRAEDWATWLDALAHLDKHHLQRLSGASGLPAQPAQLILLGADRRATLTLQPRSRLLAWLPAPKKNWNSWWSRPV
ncbi:hypothetical protein [Bordetella genomosp. 4]|uniref:hypothetical protein n=1 Tax=Bordetella genomosp. 4 TaxID=463044 RepID=UPI000B9EE8C2|nr:hypothetical protein [Bordetella genomosp. 4]OZI48693.1 hypothetical protein CAL21_12710 [Bordetella genomosp. 4]